MVDETRIETTRLASFSGAAPRFVRWRRDLLVSAGLAAAALLLYLMPVFSGHLNSRTPEARIAKEMIASGNYALPAINGKPQFNRPPLPCWTVVGLACLLDGGDAPTPKVLALAVKLAAALAAALTVLVAAFYGCVVFGRKTGLLAALVLGASLLVLRSSWHECSGLFLLLACAGAFSTAAWLVCMPNPGVFSALYLGLSLGLGFLTASYMPLLLALPLLAEVLLRRRFNARKVLLFAFAFAVAALLAAPWCVALLETQGLFASMQSEIGASFFTPGPSADDRWLYYFGRLEVGLLPWTPLLFFACLFHPFFPQKRLSAPAWQPPFAGENLRFMGLVLGLGFLIFYLLPGQYDSHLLPLLPPLAWLAGYLLSCFRIGGGIAEERLAWSQVAFGAAGAIVLALMPLWPDGCCANLPPKLMDIRSVMLICGWPIPLAAGIIFAVLHLFVARQCVEGRALRAGWALALALFLSAIGWCFIH